MARRVSVSLFGIKAAYCCMLCRLMNKCWTFELAKRWREFQSRRAAGQDQLEMGSRKKGKSTMQRLDAVVYRGKGMAAMVVGKMSGLFEGRVEDRKEELWRRLDAGTRRETPEAGGGRKEQRPGKQKGAAFMEGTVEPWRPLRWPEAG